MRYGIVVLSTIAVLSLVQARSPKSPFDASDRRGRTQRSPSKLSSSRPSVSVRTNQRQSLTRGSDYRWAIPRGGADTTTETVTVDPQKIQIETYRWQQQLYLQSRSLILRQALIERGLKELQHWATDNAVQEIDWDCALSTRQNRKSCLFAYEAPIGTKVIAPMTGDNTEDQKWITLSALNRLRRNDPSKVELLWHSQYHILNTWFHPNRSPFSLYTHLTPAGTALSCLLDVPGLLALGLVAGLVVGVSLTWPIWHAVGVRLLTSSLLWMSWPQWGRFIHAALPLQMLLAQYAGKAVLHVFGLWYDQVRRQLVELECQMLEKAIPLTIVEGGGEEEFFDAVQEQDDDDDSWLDEEDDDDEDFDDII